MTSQSEGALCSGSKVSVIVANLNGAEFLPACISSALAQQPVPEIIVVDNGSTDQSVNILRASYPSVRVIKNEDNRGFAEASNQGAAIASGEFLLFLNNDSRLMSGSLVRLVAALRTDSRVAACQPTMLRNDGKLDSAGSMFTKTGFLHHVSEYELSSARFDRYRFSLKGACMLVRADLFNRAGRFDESYFAYFEETDLCWRFLAMGHRLEHVSDATLIHDVGRTTAAIFPSAHIDFLSFRNRITTIRKNGDTNFKLRVLTLHIACCLGVMGAFVLTGKFKNAFSILRAIAWHMRPSNQHHHLVNRQIQPTSMEQLAAFTVPMKLSMAFRLLESYVTLRW
jgi:GT2 family glycosyltransferase